MLHSLACEHKRAPNVEIVLQIEALLVQLFDTQRIVSRCIVNQHINAAKALYDRIHCAHDLLNDTQVALHSHARTTDGIYLRHNV